ncbi:MAG TPA: hypothetical protein GX704_06885 [Clostridiales bacterium]|jgi:hypothetical protein|nr:hypothetical protein [Clostridiales bacterium]
MKNKNILEKRTDTAVKRSFKKKLLLIIAAAVILLLSQLLSGCGSGKTVMKYGKAGISDRIYRYMLVNSMEYYLESLSGAENTPEFWAQSAADGLTLRQFLEADVEKSVKTLLVAVSLFEDYGMKLTPEAEAAVDQDLQDIEDSYGSKPEMNADLGRYGINADILREIFIMQEKEQALYDFFYGDRGIMLPTDEELDAYYKDNYIRIKYIALHLYKTVEGVDGLIAMTDEEKQEVYSLSEQLLSEVKSGADFDALMAQYNQDDLTAYPGGVYLSNIDRSYDIVDRAFLIEIGDTEIVDQEKAVYIVRRLELEEDAYMSDTSGQFGDLVSKCCEKLYFEALSEHHDEVEVNGDLIASIGESVFGSE